MLIFLKNLKGNPKSCIITEPLWGIPFNLYAPFFTVFMFQLGVMDAQIGLIMGIGRFLQVFMALFGGVITDKFGRRRVTFIGDCLSWSVPVAIWAFSQNFWWFLAAAVINSTWQITAVSWECLWVDETYSDTKKTAQIYNWMYISGMMAVFFAPIAGLFVGHFSLVPVVRVLMGITFVSMSAKFILLYIYSNETERGLERMQQTRGVSFWRLMRGYTDVLVQIAKSWRMSMALALQGLAGVAMLTSGTFFALFATQNIGLPEHYLAYFPILRAGVMLVFFLVVQNKLNIFAPHRVMICGVLMFIAASIVLIASAQSSIIMPTAYTIIEACAVAMVLPRLDTLAAKSIEPQERARLRGMFNAIIVAISAPLVYLAGQISAIDRRLPFVLNIGLFAIMIVLFAIFGALHLREAARKA